MEYNKLNDNVNNIEKHMIHLEDIKIENVTNLGIPISLNDVTENNLNFNLTHAGPRTIQSIQAFQDENVITVPIQFLQLPNDAGPNFTFTGIPSMQTLSSETDIQLEICQDRKIKNCLYINKKREFNKILSIGSSSNIEDSNENLMHYSLDVDRNLYNDSSNSFLTEEIKSDVGYLGDQYSMDFHSSQEFVVTKLVNQDEDDIMPESRIITIGKDLKESNDVEPPLGSGPWKCQKCNAVFHKWFTFKKHEKKHKEDKPYECPHCVESFNYEKNLMLHMSIHDPDKLKCPACEKSFRRLASLKAHLNIHLEDEIVVCFKCNEAFFSLNQLEDHVIQHEYSKGKDSYSEEEISLKPPNLNCNQCKLSFPTLSSLKNHLAVHKRMRKLTGPKSRRKFTDRSKFEKKCLECGKGFQKPSQLLRHVRIHTGERPFKCNYSGCDRSFKQKGSLLIHMDIHGDKRKYVCELCQKAFVQKSNLRCHMLRVHPVSYEDGPRFHCDECPCVFKKANSLNAHISKEHMVDTQITDDPSRSCEMERLVQELQNLQKDNEKYSNDSQIQLNSMKNRILMIEDSDIVQQALKKSGLDQAKVALHHSEYKKKEHRLSKHQVKIVTVIEKPAEGTIRRYSILARLQGDVKWYLCNFKECNKEFKKPSDLVRHIRIHTQEKPFKCKECPKAFSIKATLGSHMKTHLAEKEYMCQICSKTCTTASSLKTHSWIHSGFKPYKCPMCAKTFRTISQRKTHILSHSQSPYRMHSLKKKSMPLPDIPLQEPILITEKGQVRTVNRYRNVYAGDKISERPHQCHFCPAAFKKSSHLKQHERTHTGEKPFSCDICSKSFSCHSILSSHKKIHSGTRSHRCVECTKIFTSKGSLIRHISTHSSVRPYMCPYCHKTFKTNMNCKKHMKIHKQELAMDAIRSAGANLQDDSEQALMTANIYANENSTTGITLRVNNPSEMAGSSINSELKETSISINDRNNHFTSSALSDTNDNNAEVEIQATFTHDLVDGSITLTDFQPKKDSLTTTVSDKVKVYSISTSTTSDLHSSPATITIPQSFIEPQSQAVTSEANLHNLSSVQMNNNELLSKVFISSQLLNLNQSQSDTEMILVKKLDPDSNSKNVDLLISDSSQEADNLNSFTFTAADDVTVFDITSQSDESQQKQTMIHNLPESFCNQPIVQVEVEQNECFKDTNCLTKIKTITDDFGEKCVLCLSSMVRDQEDNLICIQCSQTITSPKKTRGGIYCNLCKIKFTHQVELTNHNRKIHRSEFQKKVTKYCWSCPVCKSLYDNLVGVQDHVSSHTVDQISAAMAIEKMEVMATPNEDPLRKVEITSAVVDSLFEEDESIVSNRKEQIVENDNDMKVLTLHACEHCGKEFRKPSDLTRHIRTHTGEKPYQCNQCSKKFAVKSTLDVHYKTHTGKREFKCKICNVLYSSNGSLKIHMRIHTGSKPLKCHLCTVKFRTSGARKSHMAKHFQVAAPVEPQTTDGSRIMDDKEMIISDSEMVQQQQQPVVMNPVTLQLNGVNYDLNLQNVEMSEFDSVFQMPMAMDGVRMNANNIVISTQVKESDLCHEQQSIIMVDQMNDPSSSFITYKSLLPKDKKKTLNCTYPNCKRCFGNEKDLQFHVDTLHNMNYECSICSEPFLAELQLQHHMFSEHDAQKSFKCCDNHFTCKQHGARCPTKLKNKETVDEDTDPLMIRDLFLSQI